MTWEALNTVFAGGTFLVIAVTAVTATIQLHHLRASNQLVALTTVMGDWQRPQLQEWLRFVRWDLVDKLKDRERGERPAALETGRRKAWG